MRRWDRIILLVALIAIVPVLAGCESFDPEDLDVFGIGKKKKLPGDRQPVFPSGVPGVSQGVPPEFMHGNQPPPDSAQAAPVQPVNGSAAPAAELDDSAAAAGEKKPSKTAAVGPTNIMPGQEAAPKTEPKPKPKAKAKPKPKPKPKPVRATVQPAAQQQQQQQQQSAPWPDSSQSNSAPVWPSGPAR